MDHAFNICAVIEEDHCYFRASNTRLQSSTEHGSPSKAKTLCYKANKVLVKILLRFSTSVPGRGEWVRSQPSLRGDLGKTPQRLQYGVAMSEKVNDPFAVRQMIAAK